MSKLIGICIVSIGLIIACAEPPPKSPNKKEETTKLGQKTSSYNKESKTADTGDQDTQTEPTPKEHIDKAKEIIASVKKAKVADVDAKKKFKSFCSSCHGFDGNLMVNGAKDLTKSTIPLEESVAQLYFGKGLMTPFKGILSDEEIVAVAKYTEELRK